MDGVTLGIKIVETVPLILAEMYMGDTDIGRLRISPENFETYLDSWEEVLDSISATMPVNVNNVKIEGDYPLPEYVYYLIRKGDTVICGGEILEKDITLGAPWLEDTKGGTFHRINFEEFKKHHHGNLPKSSIVGRKMPWD